MISECGHTKTGICDFVENIITNIQETHLVRFLPFGTSHWIRSYCISRLWIKKSSGPTVSRSSTNFCGRERGKGLTLCIWPTPRDIIILLHSGLNPPWHFWLSTRVSCCLKMKSVENILGYIREQFYRFSRGCKPRENLRNFSRKYTKMFKSYSFLGNKNWV